MSNDPQDLSILLDQLELLQEQNEFLQSVVDFQNLMIQEIQEQLRETKQELELTNHDLSEALRDEKLRLIEDDPIQSELTQEYFIQLLTLIHLSPLNLEEFVSILSILVKGRNTFRSTESKIEINQTRSRKSFSNLLIQSINLRTEAKNLKNEAKSLRNNLKDTEKGLKSFKNNFVQFKTNYQKTAQ